jgi:hypothetical protein
MIVLNENDYLGKPCGDAERQIRDKGLATREQAGDSGPNATPNTVNSISPTRAYEGETVTVTCQITPTPSPSSSSTP